MAIPDSIIKLIERFDFHRVSYINSKETYNETKLRQDYLDHFFVALGWDVYNKQGWSEQAREVSLEQPIKIQGTTDFIDYSFKIGRDLKFIAEAKAPKVRIKDNTKAAYQVRRYAWNAKQALCILTNFDEFAVYDCTKKPSSNDGSVVARIDYFSYKELPKKWDEIVSIFSKDAVYRGSFDRFAESTKGKKGTASVDDEFLKEIESWRDDLAKNIALRNKTITDKPLTVEELNYSVQTIIDRIIFLRICEDRGLEQYETLKSLIDLEGTYVHLCNLFKKADIKYNSGIFHFEKEEDREEPDTLTLELKIDDKILKGIIKSLYYPESQYEFSVIPPAILGHVYEQFLGKIIRLTEGHHARIELKPEVYKAGGVFYTPQYIVDYIVRKTLEDLVKDKTPREVSKIRILDPACGSGSFLLGAYDFLLEWHLEWYTKNLAPLLNLKIPITDKQVQTLLPETIPRKKKVRQVVELPIYSAGYNVGTQLLQRSRSDWQLGTSEKKRILLNNIFGVDIDRQAVEVTKLSLLLKVLEGEKEENLDKQLRLCDDRALPSLYENIKCGNSLVGPDIINPRLSIEDLKTINFFNWVKEFPEANLAGGFDAVIGNPPWGSYISDFEKDHLNKNYVNKQGEAESHLFFIEKGIKLLKPRGVLGYITPNTWLTVNNSKEIRNFLLNNISFKEICELTKNIFEKAPDIVPILTIINNEKKNDNICKIRRPQTIRVTESNFSSVFLETSIQQKKWLLDPKSVINIRSTDEVSELQEICERKSIPLKDICTVVYGIKTGDNKKFLSKESTSKNQVKALKTGELIRYRLTWKGYFLNWSKDLAGYRETSLEVPKIIVQYIRKLSLPRRIVAAYDGEGIYYPLNNYSYITQKDEEISLKFVLGIINSSLMNFYFANKFIDYNIKPTYLQQLPIRVIDKKDKNSINRYNQIILLVDLILELNKKYQDTKLEQEKEILIRQIETADDAIDKLVYDHYGLTNEQISLIESEHIANMKISQNE